MTYQVQSAQLWEPTVARLGNQGMYMYHLFNKSTVRKKHRRETIAPD